MEDLLELAARGLARLILPVRRRLSGVRVGGDEVWVRNFPLRSVRFAADRVDRFDWSDTDEGRVAMLHLITGDRLPVLALRPSHPGAAATLNNSLRR